MTPKRIAVRFPVRTNTSGSYEGAVSEMVSDLNQSIEEYRSRGWVYLRMEEIPVNTQRGCLGTLVNALTLGIFGGEDAAGSVLVAIFEEFRPEEPVRSLPKASVEATTSSSPVPKPAPKRRQVRPPYPPGGYGPDVTHTYDS